MLNQTVAYQDPSGASVTGCTNLLCMDTPRVWYAVFNVTYGNVTTNPFKGHAQGGDIVVATFTDPLTHVYILGAGGATDTIY